MSRPCLAFAFLFLLLVSLSPPAWAGPGIVNVVVSGNEVTAAIDLPLGLDAGLKIVFEDATGVTAANLGMSARLISPLDPSLLARLPPGGLGIPLAFPVLLTFNPPPGSPLTLRGIVRTELHVLNLHYTTGTLLRLFAARPGGPFREATAAMGPGSYRVGGVHPEFYTEQMIVIDARTHDSVITRQLGYLQETLNRHVPVIAPAVLGELQSRFAAVSERYAAGATTAAIEELAALEQVVVAHSGDDIPEVWQAEGNAANAAGELRSDAAELRFSLLRKNNTILPF